MFLSAEHLGLWEEVIVDLQVCGADKIPKGFLSLTHPMRLFVISSFLTLFFQKSSLIQESHHER